MNSTERVTAVGVFDTRHEAEKAVEQLRRAGFSNEQIGIAERTTDSAGEVAGAMAEVGAIAGAISGGALGVLGGIAVAAGVISPIGPVVAGGALGGILVSAAAGAAVGGVVGTLLGLGVPLEDARYYESELAAGRTLVTVQADDRYDEAVAILHRCGAHDTVTKRMIEPPPIPIL